MILKDILASAVGIGPNYKILHQDMRDLLRLDGGEYTPTSFSILDMYYTFPFLDYGSTKEIDDMTAVLMSAIDGRHHASGGSRFDQWYNAANPDGKKYRENREGVRFYYDKNVIDNQRLKGPQILYNYYENGSWPGPRLGVMIVDRMRTKSKYGTNMSDVRYGFKAKLNNWNQDVGEYQDMELTHLYIDGGYVPLSPKTFEAANDYAVRLVQMIFQDDGARYDPKAALAETLEKYGAGVFATSAWRARRESAVALKCEA